MLSLYEIWYLPVAQPPSAVATPKANTGEGACATLPRITGPLGLDGHMTHSPDDHL